MTKEQKKAIEKIKRQITIGECEKNIGIPVYISDLKTILSMLEEQEYKIRQLGKGQQTLIQSRKKWKHRYYKMKNKNKEQDKIIDLMSEMLNNHDIDEDICMQMGKRKDCNEFTDKENCKACIK